MFRAIRRNWGKSHTGILNFTSLFIRREEWYLWHWNLMEVNQERLVGLKKQSVPEYSSIVRVEVSMTAREWNQGFKIHSVEWELWFGLHLCWWWCLMNSCREKLPYIESAIQNSLCLWGQELTGLEHLSQTAWWLLSLHLSQSLGFEHLEGRDQAWLILTSPTR